MSERSPSLCLKVSLQEFLHSDHDFPSRHIHHKWTLCHEEFFKFSGFRIASYSLSKISPAITTTSGSSALIFFHHLFHLMTADAVPQMKICDERNFQMCILFRWNLISCRVNMDCMHHSIDAHSRHKRIAPRPTAFNPIGEYSQVFVSTVCAKMKRSSTRIAVKPRKYRYMPSQQLLMTFKIR